MPELRRYNSPKTLLWIAAIFFALLLITGLGLMTIRAEVSEGSTVNDPVSTGVAPVPDATAGGISGSLGSGATEPSGAGASGFGAPGADISGAGNSSGPVLTDPDQSVSSDDPPAPPRPARPAPADGIDSFEKCAAAGYPIAESYPEQCFTPDGRGFTRQIG